MTKVRATRETRKIGNTKVNLSRETEGEKKKVRKTPQKTQLYRWFFTYNNYLEDDILKLRIIFNKLCKKYSFQKEVGENGTPHLQGCISLKKKLRLEQMKDINEKIHWEPTKNSKAAEAYCIKEKTSLGERWTHEKIDMFKRTKSKFDEIKPREEIIKIITKEPDNRTINWIWSEKGAVGKTSTAAYIENHYNGVCIANGKGADIKNQAITHLEENDLDLLIINIPRVNENYVSYPAIEEIKDGLIYSGKYEGGFANIEHPHVIILANFEPDISKLSEDRWNIINLDSQDTAAGRVAREVGTAAPA